MKTILVNPNARLYQNVPPLALAYIATTRGAKVIDQNTMPVPKDRFLKEKADVLGVFVRSITFSESERIALEYKKKYPQAIVKSIYTPIDVQCCYPTIQFEEKIELTEPFGDSYPFPDFSLFDSYETFVANWQKDLWQYGILTSVGCPFRCIYCAARMRGWKARTPENCVEELRQAKKNYKIVSFEVLDDAFNVNKTRLLEFCRLVKPLKLHWVCANGLRADLFDEEEASAMAKAGCDSVSFGVESTDPKVLETIKKGETIEKISKGVDTAKKYFRNVNGFFIIGLPGSSYQKDLKSIEWMTQKRVTGVFSFYVPFDKQLEYDDMFYGESAKPQSNEYPKHLQEEIYKKTAFMTSRTTPANILIKIILTLKLVWEYDKKNLFPHLLDNVRRVMKNK